MPDRREIITLPNASADYPVRLRVNLGKAATEALEVIGNSALLQADLLGLFCSVRCPGNEILKLYDVARGLRDAGVAVVSGFHTPMEKECLITLLRGEQPIIICPARSLQRMKLPPEWSNGIERGRLAVVSAFAPTVRRATKETAAERNRLVAAIAKDVLIAYAEPEGQTARLASDLTKAGRPPLTLASPEVARFTGFKES